VIPLNKIDALVASDDIDVGRQKIRLSFDLPRGSYATILVKRLTELNSLVPQIEDVEPEEILD
jgi:tRNA(Glu) U13 pseudouridine synthase TruD